MGSLDSMKLQGAPSGACRPSAAFAAFALHPCLTSKGDRHVVVVPRLLTISFLPNYLYPHPLPSYRAFVCFVV